MLLRGVKKEWVRVVHIGIVGIAIGLAFIGIKWHFHSAAVVIFGLLLVDLTLRQI